ncbi:hypothetical protein GCM10008110_04970 [Marinobacter persicus]|nr:hypothetical protein GCM10008110_04970 [Marinobacter persicus]
MVMIKPEVHPNSLGLNGGKPSPYTLKEIGLGLGCLCIPVVTNKEGILTVIDKIDRTNQAIQPAGE